MKEYVFIGAERTGKTSCMLVLAKILAKVNKKVLVIDTTKSQGVYSFFEFNPSIECKNSLNEVKPIVREDFEILCNSPDVEMGNVDLDQVYKKLNAKNYDYVFIEADENMDKSLINTSTKIFFFQDSDKHTLAKNKEILKKIHIDLNKIVIIFNDLMEIKYDSLYLMSELAPFIKHRELSIINGSINDSIEIAFEEQNIANFLECKIDGHISLEYFSDEFKSSIFEFINIIAEIDAKQYGKIMK